MTERERLIELLYGIRDRCDIIDNEYIDDIADELIRNDVVPVVRCKDCVFWGDEDGFVKRADGLLFGRCRMHNYLIDGVHTGWCPAENDFCACGERRNDG